MKVLLLGDYSSFHYNLAQGLRKLDIDVTVASNGDGWKDIPRDIDLKHPDKFRRVGFTYKLMKNFPKMTGFDVVQFIAPNFIMTAPTITSLYFDFLKKYNDKLFVCATGMDYHYVSYALSGKLKYSVFYIPGAESDPYVRKMRSLAQNKSLKNLDIKIASQCDGIIATSNGYFKAYENSFPKKTTYIPLPIDTERFSYVNNINPQTPKIRFSLGLMKDRMRIKGTDRIKNVLNELKSKYPNDIELTIIDSVPYNEYIELINNSHVLCDQLYAYGIGMNGLIAQSKGLIVGGGADKEMYEAIGEYKNRPILDLNTTDESMFTIFEQLLENKANLKEHSIKSREFVVRNYDCVKVAQQYLNFWKSKTLEK